MSEGPEEERSAASGYGAADRRRLEDALATGEPITCPRCSAAVLRSAVDPGPGLPYVRRRALLVCSGCRRSVAIDTPRRS